MAAGNNLTEMLPEKLHGLGILVQYVLMCLYGEEITELRDSAINFEKKRES